MDANPPATYSSPFDDFLDDFFIECDEHLTTMRQALLALESLAPFGRVDLPLLDELFRSFHSLKGLAAMVGLTEAEQLAHQMESCLRLVRHDHVALNVPQVDGLLVGVRALEQVIAARRTNASPPDIKPALTSLAVLINTGMKASNAPAQELRPDPAFDGVDQVQLKTAVAHGEQIRVVTFIPDQELAQQGINVNTVRARLQQIGTLIRSRPLITGAGLTFEFLVASMLDEAEFAARAGDGLIIAPVEVPTDPPPNRSAGSAEPALDQSLAPSQLVRVNMARLDELMYMVSELVITRARLENQFGRLESILPVADWRAIQETGLLLERQLRDLRTTIVRVRLVPIGETFARMQFVIHDLARDLRKQVTLNLQGQETEIDKFVVERMFDPLLHLVRNAVSHGIEAPEQRMTSGKLPEGILTLRAETIGDMVVIIVEDDGQGIDVTLVAEQARRQGLLEVGDSLDDDRLLDLLCLPGFSTRDSTDRVSGRGVGMNVVRKTIHGLGGTLELQTVAGHGVRFTIQVPLTLAIVDALIVGAGGQTFAVPLPLVREVVQVLPEMVTSLEHYELILHRGNVLPLVRLTRRFGLNEQPLPFWYAFIIGNDEQMIGVVVDRLLGKREIVIRPIGDALAHVPDITGATELGDGRPVLILDVAGLTRRGVLQKV